MQTNQTDYVLIGYCDRSTRKAIVEYDHHVVEIAGVPGVLFTFHLKMEKPAEQNLVIVVFDNIKIYPTAPPSVQQAMERVEWSNQKIIVRDDP